MDQRTVQMGKRSERMWTDVNGWIGWIARSSNVKHLIQHLAYLARRRPVSHFLEPVSIPASSSLVPPHIIPASFQTSKSRMFCHPSTKAALKTSKFSINWLQGLKPREDTFIQFPSNCEFMKHDRNMDKVVTSLDPRLVKSRYLSKCRTAKFWSWWCYDQTALTQLAAVHIGVLGLVLHETCS